jgi:excisionase family DNA binding protein
MNAGRGRRLLSVKAAAEYLGLAPKTVYAWIERGRLPFVALGRRRLLDAAMARLMALARRALDVVDVALGRGDTGVALAVLRGAGLLPGSQEKIGSEDPGEQQFGIDLELPSLFAVPVRETGGGHE